MMGVLQVGVVGGHEGEAEPVQLAPVYLNWRTKGAHLVKAHGLTCCGRRVRPPMAWFRGRSWWEWQGWRFKVISHVEAVRAAKALAVQAGFRPCWRCFG